MPKDNFDVGSDAFLQRNYNQPIIIQADLNTTPIFMTELTSSWLRFLHEQGTRFSDAPEQQLLHFGGSPDAEFDTVGEFVAPLTDLGLLTLSGEEAVSFLHKQVTNDVEHLGSNEVRLAGYCSPKGRLLATFRMWKSGGIIFLQLPREIQASVQKRLQMFVLRSKVKLADCTLDFAILGLAGQAAENALVEWFPALPPAPYEKVESEFGILIREPDAGAVRRYQWIAKPEVARQAWPTLRRLLKAVGPHFWRLGDIRAGIPRITSATQEKFVPQMVNFEIIGGVNFKKGCYPGQEIVARSQYLGKLKRRMYLASVAATDVSAGMEIFSDSDPEQACGMVVNAELGSSNTSDCLVEAKVAMMDAGTIRLGSVAGPELRFGTLPYPILDPA